MKIFSGRVLCVVALAAAATALGGWGKQRLDINELPGEVVYAAEEWKPTVPSVPMPTAATIATPIGPNGLRVLEPDEAQSLIEKLRQLDLGLYPCTAHFEVRMRKLLDAESTTSSRTSFELCATSFDRWTLESAEKTGRLVVERENTDVVATLPWETKGYRCSMPSGRRSGPLAVPDELLDPRFVLGVNDADKSVEIGATWTGGRLRTAYFTVDLASGMVKRIQVHLQSQPSADRRFDHILVQETKDYAKTTVSKPRLLAQRETELVGEVPAAEWKPIVLSGR